VADGGQKPAAALSGKHCCLFPRCGRFMPNAIARGRISTISTVSVLHAGALGRQEHGCLTMLLSLCGCCSCNR
jgi:hypothetical protein